jgi:rubrerythrin
VGDRLTIIDGEVDSAVSARYEASRRDAVRKGAIAGGGLIAATTIPLLLKVREAFAQDEHEDRGDAPLIEGVVQLEQTAQVAYETAAKSNLLQGSVKRLASLLAEHEKQHGDALKQILGEIGGNVPTPPKPAEVQGLDEVKSQTGFLEFAIELEGNAILTYLDLERKVKGDRLRRLGAQAMASEGEHLVMLREELGRNPIPVAFEGEQA